MAIADVVEDAFELERTSGRRRAARRAPHGDGPSFRRHRERAAAGQRRQRRRSGRADRVRARRPGRACRCARGCRPVVRRRGPRWRVGCRHHLRGRPRDGRRPGRRRAGPRAHRRRGDRTEATAHGPRGPDGRWARRCDGAPGTTARRAWSPRSTSRWRGCRASPGGGDEQARILRGRIVLASSVDDLDRAFNASKYGGLPASPPMEVTIPSLVDPDLVSESARRRGVEHVLSAIVQYAPYRLADGAAWEERRERARRPGRRARSRRTRRASRRSSSSARS